MADTVDEDMQRILSSDEPMLMYTPEAIEQTPLKTSVSTLTRQAPVISDEDSEETVEDKRKTEEAVRTFRLSAVASRPAFLEEEEAEAVNIGTELLHRLRLYGHAQADRRPGRAGANPVRQRNG